MQWSNHDNIEIVHNHIIFHNHHLMPELNYRIKSQSCRFETLSLWFQFHPQALICYPSIAKNLPARNLMEIIIFLQRNGDDGDCVYIANFSCLLFSRLNLHYFSKTHKIVLERPNSKDINSDQTSLSQAQMANFSSRSFFSVTFWIERQNLYIFHTCHPPTARPPWQETIFSFGKFLWKWEILAIDHWSETFPCGKLLKHNCSWVLVHWETLFYCFFESTSPKSNSPISPRERDIFKNDSGS